MVNHLSRISSKSVENICSNLRATVGRFASKLEFSCVALAVSEQLDKGTVEFLITIDENLQTTSVSNREAAARAVLNCVEKRAISRDFLDGTHYLAIPVSPEKQATAVVALVQHTRKYSFDEIVYLTKELKMLSQWLESFPHLSDLSINERLNKVLVELVADTNSRIQLGNMNEQKLISAVCSEIKSRFDLDKVEFIDTAELETIHTSDCCFDCDRLTQQGVYFETLDNLGDCTCFQCQKLKHDKIRSLAISASVSCGSNSYVLVCGAKRPGRLTESSVQRVQLVATTISLLVENLSRSRELQRMIGIQKDQNIKLRLAYRSTLESLLTALESKDHETHGHSKRVVAYSLAIAERLGLSGDELRDLRWGALLHDIGKIGVRDAVLLKPGKLSDGEWQEIREHPRIGYRMLKGVTFLGEVPTLVLHHHEFWNGTGYPDGLAGEEIPFGARVFAVADAFDAMTSPRPYRPILSVENAVIEIKDNVGTQFCPTCARAFLKIPIEELYRIREGERKIGMSINSM